jgi:hypothetical protein
VNEAPPGKYNNGMQRNPLLVALPVWLLATVYRQER